MLKIPENKHVTYQAQYRKCGKKCKSCSQGLRHGPYLYAYWREGAQMRSKSLGKNLKLDAVLAYVCQVYRVAIDSRPQWEALKLHLFQRYIDDRDLTQEHFKLILLECKEHISQRKRQSRPVSLHRAASHHHLNAIAV